MFQLLAQIGTGIAEIPGKEHDKVLDQALKEMEGLAQKLNAEGQIAALEMQRPLAQLEVDSSTREAQAEAKVNAAMTGSEGGGNVEAYIAGEGARAGALVDKQISNQIAGQLDEVFNQEYSRILTIEMNNIERPSLLDGFINQDPFTKLVAGN